MYKCYKTAAAVIALKERQINKLNDVRFVMACFVR